MVEIQKLTADTKPLTKEEQEQLNKAVMPMWLGITSKLGAGSIFGYLAGTFIK